MRPRHAGLAAALLLVMVAMVVAGGRLVERDGPQIEVEPIAAEDLLPSEDTSADDPLINDHGIDDPEDTAARSADTPATDTPALPPENTIDPELAAPPANEERPLERIAPRAPLSELSLAAPPKPKAAKDLTGEPLFRPVAEAAGVIEVKGQSITVSGIEVVAPDEICTDGAGKSWPCGVRARTAFRNFLRGRALTCAAPDEAGTPRCLVGGQDIGEWLVENGWARAAAGGPYEDAGKKAKAARKGIFGSAPNLSGLPPAPPPVETTPGAQGSILDLSGEASPAPTPPTGQPAPFQ